MILQVWLQRAEIKQIWQQSKSHEFFGFPMHIKAVFTYYSLLSAQLMSKNIHTLIF